MKSEAKIKTSESTVPVEIRSEAVQDILSFIPHWIIRSGITIIFFTVGLMLWATWLIKYPDIINARIVITTEMPPAPVIARASGKIERLFIADNTQVAPGIYLAAIESTAQLDDMLMLRTLIDSLEADIETPESFKITFSRAVELGEVQAAYLDFLQNLHEYQFMNTTDYYARRKNNIHNQITQHQLLGQRLLNQRDLTAKELQLSENKLFRNRTLFEKELISELELGTSEELLLQKKHAVESAETAIVNNELRLTEYEKSLLELGFQNDEKKRQLMFSLQQNFKRLESAFAGWEQRYILRAPVAGHVSFFSYWSDSQYVNGGEEVLTVVPVSGDILGKIELLGAGAGKVKTGQRVNLKFDSYPFREFGMVTAEVTSISLVARDNIESISVGLPEGLQTSYNKRIEFKQGMQGSAEIITEDLRLFERIFNQLRALLTYSTG